MIHTSIGPGPSRGGNDNRDNDPRGKTLGESAPAREPPAGADLPDPTVLDTPPDAADAADGAQERTPGRADRAG